MAYDLAYPAPSADRNTSGNSGAIATPKAIYLGVMIEVTTQAGTTPTLDISVEWSMDGTNFAAVQGTADNFTQVTTTVPTRAAKVFTVKAPYYRVVWTIGGTGSPHYTFAVSTYAIGQ